MNNKYAVIWIQLLTSCRKCRCCNAWPLGGTVVPWKLSLKTYSKGKLILRLTATQNCDSWLECISFAMSELDSCVSLQVTSVRRRRGIEFLCSNLVWEMLPTSTSRKGTTTVALSPAWFLIEQFMWIFFHRFKFIKENYVFQKWFM